MQYIIVVSTLYYSIGPEGKPDAVEERTRPRVASDKRRESSAKEENTVEGIEQRMESNGEEKRRNKR